MHYNGTDFVFFPGVILTNISAAKAKPGTHKLRRKVHHLPASFGGD